MLNIKCQRLRTLTDKTPISKHTSEAPVLGRLGNLETRLARSKDEIRAAQGLRYEVFYSEMGATPNETIKLIQRDTDEFDRYCDHLLVVDVSTNPHRIVGTYRVMMQNQAILAGGYYTQKEYNLAPLFAANPSARFLELGRSCVLSDYRNKRTMELLWHGAWSYAVENKIDIMFGCASFPGVDPKDVVESLVWLSENAAMDSHENCESTAISGFSIRELQSDNVNLRAAMSGMPALLKGYLRLGAKIGSHAVIDHQFGTIDVLVVLKVADINPRYLTHFGADASRFSV